VPYYNGKWVLPLLLAGLLTLILVNNPDALSRFFSLDTTGGFWAAVEHKILLVGFLLVCLVMTYFTFTRNLSLIPVLGLLINLYLMTEVGLNNWKWFLVWLFIGLIVYFSYGYRNSKLHRGVS
jgi:hypothetical protein